MAAPAGIGRESVVGLTVPAFSVSRRRGGSTASGPSAVASLPVKSAFRLLTAAALSLAVVFGASAASVHAQADDSQGGSQEQSQDEQRADYPLYDGRSADGQIDLVVTSLASIAAVMTVMLGFFLWHTSPRRRLQVARRRADSRVDELRGLVGSRVDELRSLAESGDGGDDR